MSSTLSGNGVARKWPNRAPPKTTNRRRLSAKRPGAKGWEWTSDSLDQMASLEYPSEPSAEDHEHQQMGGKESSGHQSGKEEHRKKTLTNK